MADGEGKIMYLKDSEVAMILDYRKEREQILINEENEKSSNQKAVEGIEKLKKYLSDRRIMYNDNPVDNAIQALESRLTVITEYRNQVDKIRGVLDND